jgi:uncharacterized membrane-anchored protein YjiN (DUF445 family)
MTPNISKPDSINSIKEDSFQVKTERLKKKLSNLTKTDLDVKDSKVKELIDNLHTKLGNSIRKTKGILHKFINGL